MRFPSISRSRRLLGQLLDLLLERLYDRFTGAFLPGVFPCWPGFSGKAAVLLSPDTIYETLPKLHMFYKSKKSKTVNRVA